MSSSPGRRTVLTALSPGGRATTRVLPGDGSGYPTFMQTEQRRQRDDRPVLLFFSNRRSGPARRMSSLIAWVGVTEKKRLRVVEVDADANARLAQALEVSCVPTVVLLRGEEVLGRLDGRATGTDLSRLIEPHVR